MAPFTPENGGPRIRKRFRAELDAGASPFRFPRPTELDAGELRTRSIGAFALSEHDWRDEVRLGEPEAIEFLQALDARFERVESFYGMTPRRRRLFDWGVRPTPHDWLYPFLEQRVYR